MGLFLDPKNRPCGAVEGNHPLETTEASARGSASVSKLSAHGSRRWCSQERADGYSARMTIFAGGSNSREHLVVHGFPRIQNPHELAAMSTSHLDHVVCTASKGFRPGGRTGVVFSRLRWSARFCLARRSLAKAGECASPLCSLHELSVAEEPESLNSVSPGAHASRHAVRVLIDTNVVFDVFERRQPDYSASNHILKLARRGRIAAAVASQTVANCCYIYRVGRYGNNGTFGASCGMQLSSRQYIG
jgi:hypothetical protein